MPRPLALAYAHAAAYAAAMAMAIPLIFQHLERGLGASPTTIGLLAALFGGVQVAVRLPLGARLDRRGEHGALVVSWLLTAVAGTLFLVASTLTLTAAAIATFGAAIGAFWVAANTLVTRLAPPGELARTTTHYMVAVGAGFTLGPLLGGVADLVGFEAALGALVVFGLAGYFALAPVALPPRAPTSHGAAPAAATGLWLGLAAAFTFGFILGAADTFVPVHLAAAGYSALAVGLFFASREGANLVTRLSTVRVVRDHTGAAFLAVGMVLEAVGLVLFPRSGTALGLGVAALATGAGIGLLGPSSLTLTARATPIAGLGRAMGRYGTALGVGVLVGPALLGPVGDAYGLVRIFDGTALLCVVLGGCALASVRPRRARNG